MLRQAYPLWSGYGDKIISDQVKFVQFDQLNAPGQLFYSFFLSWLAVLDWIYKYAHLEKKAINSNIFWQLCICFWPIMVHNKNYLRGYH